MLLILTLRSWSYNYSRRYQQCFGHGKAVSICSITAICATQLQPDVGCILGNKEHQCTVIGDNYPISHVMNERLVTVPVNVVPLDCHWRAVITDCTAVECSKRIVILHMQVHWQVDYLGFFCRHNRHRFRSTHGTSRESQIDTETIIRLYNTLN